MADVGSARVEVEGDVRNFARQTERDLNRALKKVKPDQIAIEIDTDSTRRAGEKAGEVLGGGVVRGADGKLRDSRGKFVKMGEKAGEVLGDGITQGADGRLKGSRSRFFSVGAEAAGAMTDGLNKGLGALSALGTNPYVAIAGVAVGVALAAALLPALGAALAGAVISVGGLSIIGLGAALLKKEPEIQAAGKRLKSALTDTFSADTAAPLLKPFVVALQTFDKLIRDIKPQVEAMFASIGGSGAIESLAKGLAGLVKAALPGFQELVKVSGPLLKSLGEQLPIIGEALSQFFSSIASGGPGATLFFKDLVTFVAASIITLGQFIGWLARVYPAVRQFFIDVGTWVAGAIEWLTRFGASVGAALAPLVPVFRTAWALITAVVRGAWAVISGVVKVGIALIQGVIRIGQAAISGSWSATWAAIKSTVTNVTNAIHSVVSSWINGVRSVISSAIAFIRAVWTAGWNAMVSIVSGAASRARSVVSGLISTIRGMFAAAGGWLVSAGRRIIDGLISGIRSGFDRVRGLLSDLTSLLPDWKGPASVDSKILEESGRMVIGGFEEGLASQFASVRRTLGDLTNDLPSFTADAAARGGDGASAANPGGQVSLTIQAGAIVIQGQGTQAGEEAAEAVLEKLAQAVLAG